MQPTIEHHPAESGLERTTRANAEMKAAAAKRVNKGANWFFIIAALSFVNSVLFLTSADIYIVAGLAMTQFVDGVAQVVRLEADGNVDTIVLAISFAINLAVVGIFVLFGVFARRRYTANCRYLYHSG